MTIAVLPQGIPPGLARVWYDAQARRFATPGTLIEQRAGQWGAWRVHFEWDNLEPDDAAPLLAHFDKVGLGTQFTVYDPLRDVPRGTARGPALAPVGSVNNWSVTGSLDLSFVAATGKITKTGAGFDALLAGATVLVTGSTNNNGTFTVVASTANDLTVEETLVDEANTSATVSERQKGRTLKTVWPTLKNQPHLFLPGDLFGCADTGEVYSITETCASDADGNTLLVFAQYIRTSPADGEHIIAEEVPIKVWLDQAVVPEGTPPVIYSLTMEATEYLSNAA